jgi:hypothetical protein
VRSIIKDYLRAVTSFAAVVVVTAVIALAVISILRIDLARLLFE